MLSGGIIGPLFQPVYFVRTNGLCLFLLTIVSSVPSMKVGPWQELNKHLFDEWMKTEQKKNYNGLNSKVRLIDSEANNYLLSADFALSRMLSHETTEKNNTQPLS